MNYREYKDGIQLSTLGYGVMRLPAAKPGSKYSIDFEESFKIIDKAYEQGVNYFDTAYVYNGGDSERCLGECMKKYPRDSFCVASKFNIDANPDYEAVFEEQLKRLQMDRIDFYLIHCLLNANLDRYCQSGAIEYFREQQKKGRIKYLGFSSHADPDTLQKFVDRYEWDFAQLQINYYDWDMGTAKQEYEILREKNIPIMVMEPVRGGRLAGLSPEADSILKEAHSDWSIASWALRFVNSLPGVQVVLSGMSTMDQMMDNLATFSGQGTLSEEDKSILMKANDMFKSQIHIPCTACRYCCDTCPMSINIPEYLKLYNNYKLQGPWAFQEAGQIQSKGKPADCISCGACMVHCPQGIQIPDLLHELADIMEKNGADN